MKPDREPDFVIGSPDRPYMQRWWVIPRNERFNIYYHRILRDDDDRALHDHPWASISYMVSGRLREITKDGWRIIEAGEVVVREADFAHRLELIDGEPAETLFITGPVIRRWGFHCPKGWVHWRDFVAVNPGEVRRGCGEMA